MTRSSLAMTFALGLATAGGAEAQTGGERGPVVIELFTSQGCSSCPPADAMLGEIAERDGIIALALHVDYWDYIGWADTFAQAAFTARQHGYGRAAGSNVVYTPQMVVGGVDHVVGNQPMQLMDLIAVHAATEDPVSVTVTGSGNARVVRAEWRGAGTPPAMVVQLVSYQPVETVAITRGENAGREVAYHNAVLSWQVVGDWTGGAPFEVRVTTESDQPHVVIVQSEGFGPILGAARVD